MKKIYFNYLFLLSVILVACDGDGGDVVPAPDLPDTSAPEIIILAPTANGSLPLIDWFEIFATITDNRGLNNVRVIMAEPNGARRVLSNDTVTQKPLREFQVSMLSRLPKNAATGHYSITVEAKDQVGNVDRDSVTFALHASDINSTTFAKSVYNALVYSLGYNPWDYSIAFDSLWLSSTLYRMVSTDEESSISEAEWNRFIADFNVQNQSWAKWDGNRDGNLDGEEFHKGISSLSFLKDWDRNRDQNVTPDEMADGIFSRWDLNKDKLLSREEYLEKYYTYLYRQ